MAYAAANYAVYDSWDIRADPSSNNSGSWINGFGTSFGAPQWAGLIAIANQGRALERPDRGPLNGVDPTLPLLYSLPAGDFHQIPATYKLFDNFEAGSYVVGSLGSPQADRLVPDLVSPFRGYYSRVVSTPATSLLPGQLVVYGNDNGGTDHITLRTDGTDLVVTDNNLTDRFPLGSFSSISVNTRASVSTVDVEQTGGVPLTVNLASSIDTVNISPTARDLGTVGGDVTVNGGSGLDTLNVNDQADLDAARQPRVIYDLRDALLSVPNGQTLSRTALFSDGSAADATVNFGNVKSVVLNASPYGNEIDVEATRPVTPVTVNAGAGSDTINVGSGADRIGAIRGGLTINGQGARTILNVNDDGTANSENYQIYATSIQRFAAQASGGALTPDTAAISYQQVGTVSLRQGSARFGLNFGGLFNTTDVFGTAAGTTTTLNAGTDHDSVAVGSGVYGSLAPIQGDVVFNPRGYYDMLILYDDAAAASQTYTITPGRVSWGGTGSVRYTNPPGGNEVGQLFLDGGWHGNVFNVNDPGPLGVGTYLTTGMGNDLVNVTADQSSLTVSGLGGADTVRLGSAGTGPGDTAAHQGRVDGIGSYAISVVNTYGTTALVADDSGGPNPRAVDIGDSTAGGGPNSILGLSRGGIGWIPAGASGTGGVTSLTVYGGGGGNTFAVRSTAATVPVTLTAGSGNDTVTVGDTANTLAGIQGGLTVNGQGSNTTLNLNDQGSTASFVYNVYADRVHRQDATSPYADNIAPVVYHAIANLALNASNGRGSSSQGSLLGVDSTAPGTNTDVYGNGGYDDFVVGGDSSHDGIQGPLRMHSRATYSFVELTDWLNTTGHTYRLRAAGTANVVERFDTQGNPDMGPITWDGLDEELFYTPYRPADIINVEGNAPGIVTLVTSKAGDQVTFGRPAANGLPGRTLDAIHRAVIVQSSAAYGSPTVTVDDSADTTGRQVTLGGSSYGITGLAGDATNPGTIYLSLDPGASVNLLGGGGGNVFQVTGAAPFRMSIDGGGGNNTLDYSSYTGDVVVDLALGTATGFAGIRRIQNVTGSIGNDLLVGDGNANVLRGGTGRNILIGGGGGDQLFGGQGDNLLIAGSTAYEATSQGLTGLEAIMKEWTSGGLFPTRMAAIQQGITVNGQTYALNSSTVFDSDTAADTLWASPDPTAVDWVFSQPEDTLNNPAGGQVVNTPI